MTLRGQVHDLLEQHGPMTAAQIRDVKDLPHLSTILSQMARTGGLKRKGKNRHAIYALPNQSFKLRALAVIPAGRPAQRPLLSGLGMQPAPDFIPTITADKRMVLVSDGAPACMFTPEQTAQINALLIEHLS